MGTKDEYQFDYLDDDTFEEYKTGLRQVFEAVRYAKDRKKLKEVMEENREAYSRIDSDTRDMLEVVANIKIPENCKVMEEGEERYDMCKAFEDMRQEGFDEGIEKGIEKGIRLGILLTEAGRNSEILKALSDRQFQKKLFVEFGLEESE